VEDDMAIAFVSEHLVLVINIYVYIILFGVSDGLLNVINVYNYICDHSAFW
jgi:hypothetical protein